MLPTNGVTGGGGVGGGRYLWSSPGLQRQGVPHFGSNFNQFDCSILLNERVLLKLKNPLTALGAFQFPDLGMG